MFGGKQVGLDLSKWVQPATGGGPSSSGGVLVPTVAVPAPSFKSQLQDLLEPTPTPKKRGNASQETLEVDGDEKHPKKKQKNDTCAWTPNFIF